VSFSGNSQILWAFGSWDNLEWKLPMRSSRVAAPPAKPLLSFLIEFVERLIVSLTPAQTPETARLWGTIGYESPSDEAGFTAVYEMVRYWMPLGALAWGAASMVGIRIFPLLSSEPR